MNRYIRFSLACVLILAPMVLHSQTSGAFLGGLLTNRTVELPDSSRARLKTIDYLEAPLFELNSGLNRVISDPFMEQRVRFRVEVDRNRGFTYLIYENEDRGSFPLVGAGNLVVRRSHSHGAVDQIKLFLGQGPYVYLRFFPMPGGQTRTSFYAYDDLDPLVEDLVLPFSIQRIFTLPWQQLYGVLAGNRAWQAYLAPSAFAEYENVEAMVHTLRPRLAELPDAEDGAMDENGRLVKIESLVDSGLPGFNCSGFAKWVADGMYRQLTGAWLSIPDLKEKHFDLRGSAIGLEYEDERDPYFGLDWTRNIATEIARAHLSPAYEPEDSDVRSVPFFEYTEDLGYEVPELWQIMYILAITEPGHWYLGSINGEFGSDPVLWQHFHVAVFFPYFDQEGVFRVAVMERNLETGIDSLIRRYEDDYVHLVRVPAPISSGFDPPQIEVVAR